MPAKTILVGLFLLSLGTVSLVCLEALPQRVNADAAATDEVLVATAALSSGSFLRDKDVMWQRYTGKTEPSQIRRSHGSTDNGNLDQQAWGGEVLGAALRENVASGEPIRRNAIVRPGDRDFLQIVLLPGARAIAIPLATGGASTRLLSPGDHVDVILTQTFKNEPSLTRRSVSETVVESLRVLAIDAADTKATVAGTGFGRTVTLEVTPQQAEKISVATELGKLSLMLRSNNPSRAALLSSPGSAKTGSVEPIWAGDVSPALSDARPQKVNDAIRPAVEVLHGTKSMAVNVQLEAPELPHSQNEPR
jgi:pilus assembly protein CpaB